jgi:CBS domain-containing protein
MTSGALTCSPQTNAAEAAALMLQGDCGMLPVVDQDELVAVITDRDLFIALGTRNLRATDVTVGDVAKRQVWTCRPGDGIDSALATMTEHRVRRLPVVDDAGRVVGVLSMNDVVLESGTSKAMRIEPVLQTLQAICEHYQPLTPVHETV